MTSILVMRHSPVLQASRQNPCIDVETLSAQCSSLGDLYPHCPYAPNGCQLIQQLCTDVEKNILRLLYRAVEGGAVTLDLPFSGCFMSLHLSRVTFKGQKLP